METESIHQLTAAYALDALDEREELEFEEHLRGCEPCRDELAELVETAGTLAYAVESPPLPPGLRVRILERAREERPRVIQFPRRRVAVIATGALAAAAAAVALGLGLWANSLSNRLDQQRETSSVLADPSARTVALTGADGRLVVAPDGEAVLVTENLRRPPAGKTYEIWVFEGETPMRAGLFDGGRRVDVVRLTRRVRAGGDVAVTVERAGGVDQPTGRPVFTARA